MKQLQNKYKQILFRLMDSDSSIGCSKVSLSCSSIWRNPDMELVWSGRLTDEYLACGNRCKNPCQDCNNITFKDYIATTIVIIITENLNLLKLDIVVYTVLFPPSLTIIVHHLSTTCSVMLQVWKLPIIIDGLLIESFKMIMQYI